MQGTSCLKTSRMGACLGTGQWGALGGGGGHVSAHSVFEFCHQDSLGLHVTQHVFADWVQPALHVTDGRLPPALPYNTGAVQLPWWLRG